MILMKDNNKKGGKNMKVSDELRSSLADVGRNVWQNLGLISNVVDSVVAFIPEPLGEAEPPTNNEIDEALLYFIEHAISRQTVAEALGRFTKGRSDRINDLTAERDRLAVERNELSTKLDDLYGVPFSSRCYHALKSRVENAEAAVEKLQTQVEKLTPKPKAAAERVKVVDPPISNSNFSVTVDGVRQPIGFETRIQADRYAAGLIAELEAEQKGDE